MRKSLRTILGVVLIILGLAALLTPFTPGSWVALIGLEYLGLRVLLQRKFMSLLPAKYRDKLRKIFKKRKKNNRRRNGDG